MWLVCTELLIYRAQKKLSAIGVWENCKKAGLEAELKQIEVTSLIV